MAATPPGPVEPDKSSLFMDLFSLGSVIMIIVTCSCLSFIFEVDFSETYLVTSAKNSVSEPPNWKIFWGRIPPDPPTRLLPSALAISSPPPPPLKKDLVTAPSIYCCIDEFIPSYLVAGEVLRDKACAPWSICGGVATSCVTV